VPPRRGGRNGGGPAHRGKQQCDAQRNREREAVALWYGAGDFGAREADRDGGDGDDRRQDEAAVMINSTRAMGRCLGMQP
jgi:hypothetical protein